MERPRAGARGRRRSSAGRFVLAGQWFPAVGVLGDDGWQAHQVHFGSASHANFGDYQVDLRVPSGWVVGATGRQTAQQDHGDGTATHRYRAENVPDFAWTASSAFVERTDRFVEPGLPPVDIRLLLQRAHLDQTDRQLAAAKAALKFYGHSVGAYPWGHLTIVDLPRAEAGLGSDATARIRSYPGLLPITTRWVSPWTGAEPERQIVALVGDRIWSAKAAPDPVAHAWLGAGVNAFMSAHVMEDSLEPRFVQVERYFGGLVAWPYADVRWNRATHLSPAAPLRPAPAADTASTASFRQHPAGLETNLASRTPLMLATLERLIGWDMVRSILSTYAARATFRHPSPEEFFAIANSVSGRDLSWFFDATHRRAATFDYGVQSVSSIPSDADAIDTTVVVHRLAEGIFPVEVRVVFDDGSSVVDRWDGQRSWQALRYRRGAHALTVEVDPNRVLAFDVNRTNNTWTSRPHARQAARKWSFRWAAWLQHLLLTYAFFV